MIEIKNLLFQPLVLNLADSNKSLHLASRGKTTINDKDLSREIRNLEAKGFIKIEKQKPKPKEKRGTDK
ncbi:MAG: hypothetical protein ACE5GM_10895 [bacterium]